MNFRTVCLISCFVCQLGAELKAQTLPWLSDPNLTNLDSFGAPMDSGFGFQLGVFANGFEPSAANVASWSQFWTTAQVTSYNTTNKLFSGLYPVLDNSPPFVEGVKGWIFGRRDGLTGSQWILFRASDWLWPAVDPNPIFPLLSDWNAKDADQVVLGAIHASGSPFLMKSALVRSYAQWKTGELTGEPLNAPADDPDRDGMNNLLEFVFGTAPKTANVPVAMPVVLQSGHAVITIPRRIDHLANHAVEVSGDLVNWNSGPAFTVVLQDDASALVVRDLTPLNPSNPKRFIRLKATLP